MHISEKKGWCSSDNIPLASWTLLAMHAATKSYFAPFATAPDIDKGDANMVIKYHTINDEIDTREYAIAENGPLDDALCF